MRQSRFFLVMICFLYLMIDLQAQISEGGIPPSFQNNLKSWQEIPLFILPETDEEELRLEDFKTDPSGQCEYRIAKGFEVDLDPENSGIWEELNGGDRLWRIRIFSGGAKAIHVYFDQYIIPEGGKLFIYNKEKTDILGAFTYQNNKITGVLAVKPVRGEEITVEYFEPADVLFSGQLHIGDIGHNYRSTTLYNATGYGDSEKCNKDINCDMALCWQIEKRSVCMISFMKSNGNYYLCSGALINNARNDGKPYLLTANHCFPTYYEAQTAVFYFNYESPTCNGPDGDLSQSISGSEILATTYQLDFCLVKLSSSPPANYMPYYSGWDITTKAPTKSVCIHHPLGDVKKISFYNDVAVTGDFVYLYDFNDNTHWFIENWNNGITQGGSSGAPLYNQGHRIVGDLTGGSTVANCTSADAYFAKICHSWADYSNKRTQLKYWLDPDTTGITFLDGYDPTSTGLINSPKYQSHFLISPNPTDGQIRIDFRLNETPNSVRLYDLSGRLMQSWRVDGNTEGTQFDLTDFPSGMYIIEIQTSTSLNTQKLLLK